MIYVCICVRAGTRAYIIIYIIYYRYYKSKYFLKNFFGVIHNKIAVFVIFSLFLFLR